MIRSLIDNRYLTMLGKATDHSAFRHNLLSNNVANVNTPGYKRVDTADFGRAMREAISNQSFSAKVEAPQHIQFGRSPLDEVNPELVVQEQTFFRNDKSSVDIDLEMAEMAKNGMRYQILTQRARDYFRGMKEIIERE